LWGKSLVEKKALYANDSLSVPKGHIPLNGALAVPILYQNELIGQIVVANKDSAFKQKDKDLLESIVNSMAPILKARLERDRIEKRRRQAEKALRDAHEELERKVANRTAELQKINKELEREIAERKLAEASLQKSQEKYRLLIRSLPAIAYTGYKDWSVEFLDDKIETLTGYSADRFYSRKMKWCDVIVDDDIATAKEIFNRALKTGKTFVREYRVKTSTGEILWVQDRGQIVCGKNKEIEYISGIFFDITQRKAQEEKLKKTENLLQTVFNSIPHPLVLLDSELRVKILNEAAIRYYQLGEFENIKNICCYEAFKGRSKPCERCQIPAAVASRKSGSFERKGFMNPNILEQVNVYHFDEKDRHHSGVLISIHDITESRMMEREMVQNEKLASLGLMVSCIAHEIANPISTISFNAPILKDYLSSVISTVDDHAKLTKDFEPFNMPYPRFREDAFNIVENILRASKKLNSTLDDLRKLYSDKKNDAKSWIDIERVIDKAIKMMELEIQQHFKFLEKNIAENLPEFYTDPHAVETILSNLLINAAHAADKKDSRLALNVKQGKSWKDHLIIEIEDNGCGMDKAMLRTIFKPFFTTKAPGHGMGLGLYLCQDLVKRLDGRIEVQSEPGKGSVFRVLLPNIERRSAKRL
jgi:PAS domain S-box-containing protein